MSRRDSIDSLFLKKPGTTTLPASKSADRVRTGAISAMGASLQEMAETAKQANKLQKQLADGDAVISLETGVIDESGVADRISIDIDPQFDALVESIAEHGQQIPILVRHNPQAPGRYQIAYGRRRLKAAEKLGRPIRAIIRELSDSELIIAQGRENLDRKDLSFIERAFFAKNLEDDGCNRHTIIAALASDKADVSRYINVARQLPEDLVKLIGPAPKAGRARWMTLVAHLASPPNMVAARDLSAEFLQSNLDSDARLSAVLKILGPPRESQAPGLSSVWETPNGKRGVEIESRRGKTSLVFEEKAVPAFAQFISSKLDELYLEFEKHSMDGEKE